MFIMYFLLSPEMSWFLSKQAFSQKKRFFFFFFYFFSVFIHVSFAFRFVSSFDSSNVQSFNNKEKPQKYLPCLIVLVSSDNVHTVDYRIFVTWFNDILDLTAKFL